MIKVCIGGYYGNISRYIISNLKKTKTIEVKMFITEKKKSKYNIKNIDCVIIFNNNKNSIRLINYSLYYKKPIILGSTGFNIEEFKRILLASKTVPIFFTSNFNINFHIFLKLIFYANKKLEKFKITKYEIHNIKKNDYPSGSSLLINKITNSKYNNSIRYNKTRGIHTVKFYNKSDAFNLSHKILEKSCYIKGIINCLKYIITKKNGFLKF
ncbi:dihydrodipicolinate reductase C-terminal domain-containing protein [Candidatus Vidania fulgoroideorum]